MFRSEREAPFHQMNAKENNEQGKLAFVTGLASVIFHSGNGFSGTRRGPRRPPSRIVAPGTRIPRRRLQACTDGISPQNSPEHPDIEEVRGLLMNGKKGSQQRALLLARDLPPTDRLEILLLAIRHSKNEWIRATATVGLGQLHNACDTVRNQAIEALLNLLLADPEYSVRAAAAAGCGYLADTPGPHTQRVVEQLIRGCHEDPEWQVQFSCLVSLGNLKDMRAMPVLLRALKSDNDIIVQGAVGAIGEVGDPLAIPPLLDCLGSQDTMTRQRLAHALGSFTGQDTELAVVDALNILSKDKSITVRDAAAESLARIVEKDNSSGVSVTIENDINLDSNSLDLTNAEKKNGDDVTVAASDAMRRRLQRSFEKESAPIAGNTVSSLLSSGEEEIISGESQNHADSAMNKLAGDESPSSPETASPASSRTGQAGGNGSSSMNGQKIDPAAEYDRLVRELGSDNLTVRSVAAIGLRKLPSPLGLEAAEEAKAFKDESERIRCIMIPLLLEVGDIARIEDMLRNDEDQTVRAAACDALNEFKGNDSALSTLLEAFQKDPHWLVRCTAGIALGNIGNVGSEAESVLIDSLQPGGIDLKAPEDSVVRRHAIIALGILGSTKALADLRRIAEFTGTNEWERFEIAGCLGNIGSSESVEILQHLTDDSSEDVRNRARENIQLLKKKGF